MNFQNYRLNRPDVISEVFHEELVAIHLSRGTYHSVTGVGIDILSILGAGSTSGPSLAAELIHKYDAPAVRIERDVEEFLVKLTESLLVASSIGSPSVSAIPQRNGASRLPYVAPGIQSHDDLQQLFLLDPVHDVGAAGWPNLPEPVVALEVQTAPTFQLQIAGAHILHERFPDETVVVNGANGAYYSLYGPAEDIFLLIAENPTLPEILAVLPTKYIVTASELDVWVRYYIEQLKTAGLISVVPAAAIGEAARDLKLQRPSSSLPFSTLSFEIFSDAPATEEGHAPVARRSGLCSYRWQPENLLHATVEDGMVVADRDSGLYYSLNEPAAHLFGLLLHGGTLESLTRILGVRYDVANRELTAAVMIFVGNLLRMGLIGAYDPTGQEAPKADNSEPAARREFHGFDIKVHRDMVEQMQPMNFAAPTVDADQAAATSRATPLASYFHAYFENLASQQGATQSFFSIGNAQVMLRRAGATGGELEKSLAHLRVPDTHTPDLTIHVATGGVSSQDFLLGPLFERLRVSWDKMCGPRGELLEYNTPSFAAIYHPGPDVLSVADLVRGMAYYIKREPGDLPYWEIGSPFRWILHRWFGSRGLQFVHGGAVQADGGGVLLAGMGGAGKSTTTLLCARAGMSYAGDDYCLVDVEGPSLYSLYGTAKLKGPQDLTRLPELGGQSSNPDSFEQGGTGKAIFFVSEIWPDRMISQFPLRAIVIPAVSKERDSRLVPCTPRDALVALLPSTVAQLPAANLGDCERLSRLVSKLPAFILHLGSDTTRIPALIRGIAV